MSAQLSYRWEIAAAVWPRYTLPVFALIVALYVAFLRPWMLLLPRHRGTRRHPIPAVAPGR